MLLLLLVVRLVDAAVLVGAACHRTVGKSGETDGTQGAWERQGGWNPLDRAGRGAWEKARTALVRHRGASSVSNASSVATARRKLSLRARSGQTVSERCGDMVRTEVVHTRASPAHAAMGVWAGRHLQSGRSPRTYRSKMRQPPARGRRPVGPKLIRQPERRHQFRRVHLGGCNCSVGRCARNLIRAPFFQTLRATNF